MTKELTMFFFRSIRNRFATPTSPRSRKRLQRKLHIDALEDRAVPAAPIVQPILDRTVSSNQSLTQIPLVVSDPDGDPVHVSVGGAHTSDYTLATSLGLRPIKKPSNWSDSPDRWFKGNGGTYYLKSTGELFAWNGVPNQATNTLIGTLPPAYFYYSDLLTRPRDGDLAWV